MTDALLKPRYTWLEEEIACGATVVTASHRLARDLIQWYSDRRIAEDLPVWRTPQILAWPEWVSRLLSEAPAMAALPRVLDSASVTVLWERCLRQRIADDVLNFGGVVRQAIQAWQRVNEWSVPVAALLATAGTEDEKLFASAAAEYSELLRDNHWADPAALGPVLSELMAAAPEIAPQRAILAGFDRISPSAKLVLESLQDAGCVIDVKALSGRSVTSSVASYQDADAEHRAAGNWARQQLEKHPGAKIAIVSPQLEENPEEVARLVREGLVPGWQFGGHRHRAAANFSYGCRLADYPAVAAALQWLRWSCQGLTGPEISVLLRSDSIGTAERGGRSRIEREMRSYPDRAWRQKDWLALFAGRDESPDAKQFCGAVDGAAHESADLEKEQRSPTGWVERVDRLLAAAGWPGPEPLDSAEYQLVNRWRSLMNDFGRLDTVIQSMSWPEVVARIGALAGETIWQPDRGHGAVAVLGLLEAHGMEFDGVWVCGMDATRWPPPSRPLPYVSRQLQRERDMPDATPADTLAFAERLFAMLRGAAPRCVLSWAQSRKDAELAASSMLRDIETAGCDRAEDPGWSAGAWTGAVTVARVADDPAPPVTGQERVRGGSYTLQRQFLEPFSAFVYGRLGVRALDPFWKGLTPGARGIIIHNALHNLFSANPAQADIAKWNDREQRIGSAVDAALERPGRYADRVLQRLIGLEGRRLRQMLAEFLNEELDRAPFSVQGVETDVEYRRGDVLLHFRIDRIDRLPDGRLLVVDYKTGATKTFVTRTGELKDVQPVAYADALQEPVGGLLFINIDSRVISYRGIGDGWDDSVAEWDEILSGWRSELHDTVAALAAGDIRVVRQLSSNDARPLAILSRFEELTRDR